MRMCVSPSHSIALVPNLHTPVSTHLLTHEPPSLKTNTYRPPVMPMPMMPEQTGASAEELAYAQAQVVEKAAEVSRLQVDLAKLQQVCVCVCVCVDGWVRACVRASVRACVRA